MLVLVAACGSSEQTARYDRAAFCAALTWLGVGGVAMTPDETLALVRQLAASGPPELATELRALAQYQEARLPSAEELRENEPALTDERRVELQQELEALEAAFRPTLDQLLPRLEAECTGFVEPSPTQAPVRLEASQRSVSTLADGTTVRFVETVDPDGTDHLCILVDEPESISGMYPVDVERCSSSEDPMLAGSEGDVLRATPRRGLALPDGLVHPVFVVRLPAGHPQPVTVGDASGATRAGRRGRPRRPRPDCCTSSTRDRGLPVCARRSRSSDRTGRSWRAWSRSAPESAGAKPPKRA
ncbi:MAG: hypothetical protein IT196_07545 [Acidimicrobiales bacterium]|nr:hypothetical protein [Acidimicrobiales bacterium]